MAAISYSSIKKSQSNNTSVCVQSLASAALALPGMAAHASDAGYRVEETVVTFNHADYAESGSRMKVNADLLAVSLPIGNRFSGYFSYTKDITSGASPVLNLPDVAGRPNQVLHTGASIEDKRDIYDGNLSYYGDDFFAKVSVGNSEEDDYISNYGGIDFRKDFNDKTTTIQTSVAFSEDDVWNSYDPKVLIIDPTVYNSRKKQDLMLGLTQIMDKNTVIQFNYTYSRQTGFLTDPYKKSFIVDEAPEFLRSLMKIIDVPGIFRAVRASGIVDVIERFNLVEPINQIINVSETIEDFGFIPESRPDEREQNIGLLRVSRYLPSSDSAIHIDYRYVDDSWDANSHTLDIKWNFSLPFYKFQIAPSVRYYTQHSAFFYDTYYLTRPADGHFSSDYRLAGFGAFSYKMEISYFYSDQFNAYFNIEKYNRQYSYQYGNSKGGDFDNFTADLYSIGFMTAF